MRILLIEGDSATAQSIELMLQSEGLNVYATDLGREGVDLGKLYDYDIILLDLNLSDMSGYEVLKALRVSKVSTPILILSGLTGIEDKVRGLGFGADDYMTKPFHKDELVARIHAIVRRSKDHAPSVIETGEIKVNLDTKTVEVHNQRVHLTSKEYQMFELLSLRKGTTLTKEMFLNHLYGGMDEPDLKIIDVFIAKLRKKLVAATGSDHYIATIPGIGYALKDSAPVGPLLGIPSAFDFRLSAGKIALTSGLTNWPVFLLPTSEQDHNNRLAVCRTLAADLTSDLKAGKFNARTDYAESLKKYVQRLPKGPGEGNILLADAEARTLRNMFAADADSLSVGLGSKLKTMLEQHIGLRVYYPEIEHFYRDVQTGRIETPLPLDAVQEFVRRVGDHTPAVFDPTARDAIAGSAAPGPGTVPPPAPTGLPVDPNQPAPPPDPLGEIDPRKARDFTFAGAVNNLWKAFREGEKVHKALDGWKKAGEALQPSVQKILEWLRDFSGPGDGSPPVPPSIGV